jgi:hypothetical protein
MIGSYLESSYIRTLFILKHVTDHKFVEDVHEDSLQIPRQKNQFLCNLLDKPLKASGRPAVSRSFDLKTSGHQSNTIRTLGQAFPISTRSWIS